MSKTLQQRIRQGDTVYGPFIKINHPVVIEVLAQAGFDLVILDQEHGTLSYETLETLIRAAQVAGIAPIVRVPDTHPISVAKPLDMGAAGILVPHVATADLARQVVNAAKFAPQGMRGMDNTVRAAQYGLLGMAEYSRQANAESVVIVQVEDSSAVDQIEEIVAVPNIDCVFIGPADLSQSLGVSGQMNAPQLLHSITRVLTVCREKKVASGIYVGEEASFHHWRDMGVRFFGYSSDVSFLRSGCSQLNQQLRSTGTWRGEIEIA